MEPIKKEESAPETSATSLIRVLSTSFQEYPFLLPIEAWKDKILYSEGVTSLTEDRPWNQIKGAHPALIVDMITTIKFHGTHL